MTDDNQLPPAEENIQETIEELQERIEIAGNTYVTEVTDAVKCYMTVDKEGLAKQEAKITATIPNVIVKLLNAHEGVETCPHLKVMNIEALAPGVLYKHSSITTFDDFKEAYKTTHGIEGELPAPTLVTATGTYNSDDDRIRANAAAIASLNSPEHKDLQKFLNILNIIMVDPSEAYINKKKEYTRDIRVKALGTELAESQATDETAELLEEEDTANLTILQEIVRKENEKNNTAAKEANKKVAELEKMCKEMKQQLNNRNQKNQERRGQYNNNGGNNNRRLQNKNKYNNNRSNNNRSGNDRNHNNNRSNNRGGRGGRGGNNNRSGGRGRGRGNNRNSHHHRRSSNNNHRYNSDDEDATTGSGSDSSAGRRGRSRGRQRQSSNGRNGRSRSRRHRRSNE